MENLFPTDIILDIISRLPAESVLQCRRVCRTWRTLLCLPYFVDMHLRHRQLLHLDDHNNCSNNGAIGEVGLGLLFMIQLSYEDKRNVRLYYGEYDEDNIDGGQYSYKTLTRINHSPINMPSKIYSMIGSCNGLICFSVPRWGTIDDHVYICNPVTREYKRLTDKSFERVAVVNGFGYDPSSNEFKIVRIYLCELVQVYTLGSGSGWRNIGTTNYLLDYYVHPRSPMGVLVNGALHWLEYRKWRIVAFDLADEEFHVVPSPPCLAVGYTDYMNCFQLRKLGRCLCVVHQARSKRVDIWSLKKTKNNTNTCNTKEQEYEESWTWSREFSIKWETDFMDEYEPFALTKSGKVLLWYNRKILYRYDKTTDTLQKIGDYDNGFQSVQAFPHMNSFVSLKALGESRCRKIRTQKVPENKKVIGSGEGIVIARNRKVANLTGRVKPFTQKLKPILSLFKKKKKEKKKKKVLKLFIYSLVLFFSFNLFRT